MNTRWVLEAAGATFVLLFPAMHRVVMPGDWFVYHHRLPLTRLVDGLLLDGLAIAIAVVVAMHFLSRASLRPRRAVGAFLATLCLWAIVYCGLLLATDWRASISSRLSGPSLLSILGVWWFHWSFRVLIVLPPALAALSWWRPGFARPIMSTTRLILAAAAFCWLWTLPELAVLAARSHATQDSSAQVEAATRPLQQRRIVWILFDEMSHQLALDDPPPGQSFPNLSRLRAESVSLDNVQPVAFYTDLIVPSLLANRTVVAYRGTSEGRLLVQDKGQPSWQAYDEHRTVFATAQAEGWNPGIVGWAIPYCRLMGSLLTRCFWVPGVGSELWFEPWAKSDSTLSLALALPRAFLARLHSLGAVQTRHLELAAADDRALIAQSGAILADPNVHFVYIHFPVPHPPGVFDRQTGAFCACGNYLDNLALADQLLGRLRAAIDATAADTPTTLIISSDHSWRVPMWKASPGWTPEEEQVSHGRFEPRPVFMVHFAGQTAGSDVGTPVPELVEHDVIEGLLTGKIRGPQDVEALAKTRAVLDLQGKRLRAAAFP